MTPEQLNDARNVRRLLEVTHRANSKFQAYPITAAELALGTWRNACGIDFAGLDAAKKTVAQLVSGCGRNALFEFEGGMHSVAALVEELNSVIDQVTPLRIALSTEPRRARQ